MRIIAPTALFWAVFFILTLTVPAHAGHLRPDVCSTLEAVKAEIQAERTGATPRFLLIEKTDASYFVQAWNAAPPPSDIQADTVLFATSEATIAQTPQGLVPMSIVVFFKDGCAVNHGMAPTASLVRMLKQTGRDS